MIQPSPSPVVHLELHTGNLARACSFYSRACGWCLEQVEVGERSYQPFDWGGGLEGGVVECEASRAVWIPYLEVSRIDETTECARRFGANVLLEPREGAHQRTTPLSPTDESLAVRTDRTHPPRPTGNSDLTAMNSEKRAGLSRRHEGR
jgi:uncharacterized protein